MIWVQISKKIFCFLLLLLVSCIPLRDMSSLNMASVYRVSEQNYHPEFIAYNESDSTVRLFIKILPDEFLFARQPDDKFRSVIQIHSEIIGSYEIAKIIDSTSVDFSFNLSDKLETKVLSMSIPLNITGTFLIHCYVTDKNKGTYEDYFIPLDRISKPSRQDFLVTDLNNNPLFRNYLSPFDTINILYNDNSITNFWCKYYLRNFPLAAPPFSFDLHNEFDYQADSIFNLERSQLSGLFLNKEGFYHLQTGTIGNTGLTLFRYYNGFPDITSPRQMIDALRYLTNKKEFEEMKTSQFPKSMVDNFWLSHGGNEEKTRNLIKKYYGRVREANKYFSSYTEGWRTDRGMIYILFGSPGTVNKSAETESWTFGTPNSTLALNFLFIKVINPFSDNDFSLSRSPTYESSWYRAVEIWRQGRAYNSFN